MSSTVSAMTLAFGCATSMGVFSSDSGTSAEAGFIRKSVQAVTESAEKSQALFGSKAEAIERIWALHNECSVDNWDGYRARALPLDSIFRAIAFIRALPSNLPIPEFTAESDGAISLDWGVTPFRSISLSIGASDRLGYAWLDGSERGHAVAFFADSRIPSRLLDAISGIINANDAFGTT